MCLRFTGTPALTSSERLWSASTADACATGRPSRTASTTTCSWTDRSECSCLTSVWSEQRCCSSAYLLSVLRAVSSSEFGDLENICRSIMKDKQRFERLEVHKETLLEMFKVRTRFNTSALQLKEPCVGIHLMRHCRNILDGLSQSNDNTNNTRIYSNIIYEISLNFFFLSFKKCFF